MDRIAELMNKPVSEIMEIAKGKILKVLQVSLLVRFIWKREKKLEVKKAIESGYAGI
jgi:hypothetical protein